LFAGLMNSTTVISRLVPSSRIWMNRSFNGSTFVTSRTGVATAVLAEGESFSGNGSGSGGPVT
jgi:hypothetical protein